MSVGTSQGPPTQSPTTSSRAGRKVGWWILLVALYAATTLLLHLASGSATGYWYLYGPPLAISAYIFGLRGALVGALVTGSALFALYWDLTRQFDEFVTSLVGVDVTPRLPQFIQPMDELDPRRSATRAYGGIIALILTNLFFGLTVDRRREHERVHVAQTMNQFRRYFSPQLVEKIVQGQQSATLASVRKDLTILFADLRGFTTLTEKLEPEELSRLLNEYLDEMTNVIFRYDGTLDKYIGDAVMAFFGDPVVHEDDPERAVRAAVEMRERFAGLRLEWARRGEADVDIGIGVNTGFVTVGNIGSQTRLDYTAVGSAVNVAARLADAARPGEILVTQRTLARVRHAVEVEHRGGMNLQGVPYPVDVVNVVGLRVLQRAPMDRPSGNSVDLVVELAAEDPSLRALILSRPDAALKPYRLDAREKTVALQIVRLLGYPSLARLSGAEATALFKSTIRRMIPSGATIAHTAGASGITGCLVLEGEVAEYQGSDNRERHVRTMGPGGLVRFGEPHPASGGQSSFRALTKVEIGLLSEDAVQSLMSGAQAT